MLSDIEIAKSVKSKNIRDIADKAGIDDKYLEYYGNDVAKVNLDILDEVESVSDGHLILVTSTNPTPFGEGKTTMSIGLHDALCKLGKKSICALREPSLGPVFGVKGGATGGGYAQVLPMEKINLHFTGDMHALTSANNLLCAAIDNHIMQGNVLGIDPERIVVPRCLDINDRALRNIVIGMGKNNGVERSDHFVITVATELMAILCLSKSLSDLKTNIGNMMIGYNYDGNPVYVRDLNVHGSMTVLLKEAIKPNLVQTLEHNPVLIHGGPFANIAHGCNSIIATKLALKLGDYVVTEAGFGSDLGATKFLDIKCRKAGIYPSLIVLNTTIRSLKYNGGVKKDEVLIDNLDALKNGIVNLDAHLNLLSNYTNNIIVCINHFIKDSEEEIKFVKDYVESKSYKCIVSKAYERGGDGSIELAKCVIESVEKCEPKVLYEVSDSLESKIRIMAKKIMNSEVVFSDKALEDIKNIENSNLDKYPICIAKTPYSITDDAKKLGYPKDSIVLVRELKVQTGAGFIVVYMGNIMTMPGLPKEPNYLKIDIDDNNEIVGLF